MHRMAPVVAPGVPFRAEATNLGTGHDAMTAHLIPVVRHVPLVNAPARVLAAKLARAAATERQDAHRDVVRTDTRPVPVDPAHVAPDVPRGQSTPRLRLASEPVHTPAAKAGAVSHARAR